MHSMTFVGVAAVLTSLVAASPVSIPANSLAKRGGPNCNIGQYANVTPSPIKDGISRLEGLGSDPVGVAAGPGACSRVSCSYGAAISVCNDNSSPLSGVTFTDVTSAAQSIQEVCGGSDNGDTDFNGQYFMGGGWNVLIDGQSC